MTRRRRAAPALVSLVAVVAAVAGCAADTSPARPAAASAAPTQGASTAPVPAASATAGRTSDRAVVVTDFGSDQVTFLDPARRGAAADLGSVQVGAAPFGVALGPDGTAWVATAEGVAAVDTRTRTRTALTRYTRDTGAVTSGEYRGGGLGIAVSPDDADLSRLADVRAAAAVARAALEAGAVAPLRAVVANAGTMSVDTRLASADGYELTFAVNHLAHAQLIGDLLDAFSAPARIVLLGSNVYTGNLGRRLLGVPDAEWSDPVDIARPATGDKNPGFKASGVACADAKLAILYYAHELQRQAPPGIAVAVFEPGWMSGTALGRGAPAAFRAIGRGIARLPGVATPERSGPALASVALDADIDFFATGADAR